MVKGPAVYDPLFVHSDLKTTLKNNRKVVQCEPHSDMKVKQSELWLYTRRTRADRGGLIKNIIVTSQ